MNTYIHCLHKFFMGTPLYVVAPHLLTAVWEWQRSTLLLLKGGHFSNMPLAVSVPILNKKSHCTQAVECLKLHELYFASKTPYSKFYTF